MNRRKAIKILASAVPAALTARAAGASALFSEFADAQLVMTSGPFVGTRESLSSYRIPDWFRDAKFGIWAHWGPQSAAEAGDWYARNIYIQDSRQNKFHVGHYGHPSKFGHKDLIATWKGDKFDPDYLMGLYKKAGAKYFMSMGVHHDNFDLWNSKHTRWNSVKMGPKKDIVGLWQKAARKHGLSFGVSDHLWISYKWFGVSHRSDKEGPLAGVPYDGADLKFADLYHDYRVLPEIPPVDFGWNEDGISQLWKEHWFLRIKDLIDKYHPDMIYSDGHIPFGDLGLKLVAHLYNGSLVGNLYNHRHREVEGVEIPNAVYTSKRIEDSDAGICALDVERGLVDKIWPRPFQTDTCIGDWHYNRDITYKTPKRVIDMLVDVVSRNGNLMLNFPLPNSGMLDDRELHILDDITKWMNVNSEAIHATTPWKIFGTGPGTQASAAPGGFNEGKRQDLTVDDVRFTVSAPHLNAFVMGWPEPGAPQSVVIAPLGKSSPYVEGAISDVRLLGYDGTLEWKQDETGLRIRLPGKKPCDYAVAFRVSGINIPLKPR
jgi:alpha-L-fucosidase